MLRARIQRLSERGDTIVEVLISIAIVSMVLGGAYATTNKSLQATRSAQEQGVGVKLVETQIEQVKALADKVGGLASVPASFCIVPVAGVPTVKSTAAAGAPCTLNSQGVTAVATDQPQYQMAVTQPSPNNFRFINNWKGVSGKTNNTIQMDYRVYPK